MFPLDRGPGLVEQGGLLHHFHLAADAALGTDIGVAGITPPVGTEIGLGLDERAGIGDDVENALIERLGRDRLGEKLRYAGVPRYRYAALLRMGGEHDDGRVRVALGFRLPDHLRKFETVEDRHRPVGDDDVRDIVAVHFEGGGAVLGLVHLARAERVQQRAQDATHMRIVVAHQESQLVEVDAEHGTALSTHTEHLGILRVNHMPRALMNGCDRRIPAGLYHTIGRHDLCDQEPNCSLRMRSSRLWPGSNSIRMEIVLSDSTSTRRTLRASSWSATAATGRF